jgi:hypothetical protein
MQHKEEYQIEGLHIEYTSRTVGPSYDPTSAETWKVWWGDVKWINVEVNADYVVRAQITIGPIEIRTGYDTPISNKLWHWVTEMQTEAEQQETDAWLERTNGEFDHDPMGRPEWFE